MSVFGIEIQYGIGDGEGDVSLTKYSMALERFGKNITDFSKFVFPRVLKLFERTVEGQFQDRGNGTTGRWAPLSPAYAKWKEIHFPGAPLLERTQLLRAALASDSHPNGVREFTADKMAFGTVNVPYASYHQTGTPTMPVRAPFDFGPAFEAELAKEFQLGVVEAARDAGLKLESAAELAGRS